MGAGSEFMPKLLVLVKTKEFIPFFCPGGDIYIYSYLDMYIVKCGVCKWDVSTSCSVFMPYVSTDGFIPYLCHRNLIICTQCMPTTLHGLFNTRIYSGFLPNSCCLHTTPVRVPSGTIPPVTSCFKLIIFY